MVGRLTNGVRYSFRIRAMVGLFPGVESDPVSAMPVPDKPAVTATPGNALVTLSWSNPNDASITKYQIKQWTGSSESGSWTDISGSGSSTTSHVVRGLTNGVRYSFRIRAVTGTNASGTPSDPVSETPAVQPDKPAVTATPAGDSLVRLSWSNPNDASITGYQIKRWTGSSERGRWTDILGSGKDTITYTVPGLTNGVRYHFRIRAMAGRVPGMGSDVASATPVADKPIVTATPGNAQVTLSWSNPNDASITGYQIKQWTGSSESGSWTDISGSGSSTTSHVVRGLTNGVRYSFRIRAMVGAVTRTPSDPVSATPVSPPVGLKAMAGDSQVTLTWDNPNNPTITGYQLKKHRFVFDGGGFTEGPWTDIPGSGKDTTRYVVTGLTNGVRYGFEIRAVAGSVTGEESEFVPVTLSSIFTITGTVTQGQTLTADTSGISDPDVPGTDSLTFTYQWKRGGTAISGATGRTYTLTQADIGAKITVTVSWTDGGGTAETLTSTATAKVANVNDPPTGAVTITGTATQGQTLTADTSTISDPDGPSSLTFSYQWKRDGTDISGAIGRTYILTQADIGAKITVTVSWTDAGSTVETLTSAATSVAGVTLSKTSVTVTEASTGRTVTYTVVLDTQPTGEVTVTPTSSDTSVATVSTALTFTTSNWNTAQVITVTGVDDRSDADRSTTITHAISGGGYSSVSIDDVAVTLTDDDTAGVTLSKTSVTVTEASAGRSTTYTVVLDAQPLGTVTVTPTSGDTSVARVSPASLTFTTTNWNTAQPITVTGIDDSSIVDRATTITHAASGGGYNSVVIPSVSVTLTDDDTSFTLSESSLSLAEGGRGGLSSTGTYTVKMNEQPPADVNVSVNNNFPNEITVSPASLTFTSSTWNTPQTVTVTVVDNQVDNGDQRIIFVWHFLSGGGYGSQQDHKNRRSIAVLYNDNDTAGITVTETNGSTATTEAGDTDTFTVVLDTKPKENVRIAVSSSDSSEGRVDKSSLVFTDSNWNTPQTVTVTGVDDSLGDGDQSYNIVLAKADSLDSLYGAIDPVDVSVINTDDDAGVTLSKSSVTVTEASGNSNTNTYTVVLDAQPSGNVIVTPTSGNTDVATVSAALTFTTTNWNAAQTITVTGVDDSTDGERSTTITHAAAGGGYNAVVIPSVSVTLTDDDTAGVTLSKTSVTVTEASAGRTATYTVKLNTRPTGTVTVTPTSSNTGVATVSAALTFTTSTWNAAQTITVTGVDDSSDGERSTTITHAASGGGYNSVSIASVAVTLTDDDNGVPTGAVTISGTATQGQTLTADTSTIVDPDGPSNLTFTYQWKRGAAAISSATGRTYVLTQADVGSAITVTVSWTDGGGTAESLTSTATSNVANLNDSPTGAVTITGTATQGQTLTADTSTISDPDGPSNLTFTYQWKRGAAAISSATGRTYVLTQADVGSAITVTVSWTDGGGTAESLTSTATSNVANLNDSPTGAVTITGTATQGQTLTADTSTISDPDGPSNLTFTYQWKRGAAAISSATGRTYVLTQADVGAAITVTVSWTDAGSTVETLISDATSNVANLNDSPTGAVTITGTATQGQTLTADTSTIVDPDGPSNLTFTYQWKRGAAAISSATGRTYVLTQADVGAAISVTVSWTDAGSTVETLTSTATASVTNANDPPTGAVTITGTVTQGQTLTADTSTISDPDGPSNLTFTYQWKRGAAAISSATSSTYTLTQADVGAKITVTVSWTDAHGASESLTSVATASVTNANDPPTGTVTISGTATQGQTLTAVTSMIVDPDGPSSLTFTYQWKRGAAAISSATGRTYVLTQADVGSAITVTVSWTDAGSTVETLISDATSNVANVNDSPTGAVTITGTVIQGQTLTADTSTIVDPDGPSSLTFTYQWKRGAADISSATGRTYVLTQADVGAAITVTVSWTDAGSTVETLISDATSNVANINDSPTGAVTITGTVTQGQTLTADTSTISDPDGPSSLAFTYQWTRDGSDISSATQVTYTLTQADVGAAITVTVTWTDAGSTVETLTSTATANVANLNDAPTGAVTITGTVTQGQTLTADTSGISDPDGPSRLTFTYQWTRDGSAISSATQATYVLTQADVGAPITVTVTWTDAGSTVETLTSAATSNVANLNDSPTGAVTITGTVTQGQTLTAVTSTISDPDGPSNLVFTYQWTRGGNPISSATGRTYTLTQADVGAPITVTVTWTDAGSTVETLTSAVTANVANVNDPPTGAVTITGTVTQGQTLTADTSTISDPDGPSRLAFTYQWTRGGNPISSATGRTYVLTQADVGKAITVTVTWTDAGSTVETLTSAATSNVANLNDSPTGAVTITGTVTQGQTLTADTSTISDPDGPSSLTFTYQWKRGAADISSATGRTYVLTQADVGAAITVTVTWTDAGSTVESLTSAATANVANTNDSPTGAVTITGTATQGQTLTADTSGISDPDGPSRLTFTYQWTRGGNPISSATGRTYTLTQADIGAAITVTVTWTDAGSTVESLTSAATANVANTNDSPTGAVTITGTATQGQTLTADTSGISDPDGPSSLTFTYQWTRDGSAISSATQATYVLTQADVGKAITVTVSWTDAGSTVESLTSAATSNVANFNDAPTGAVTITGMVTQGETLTADTSTISDPDGPSRLTFTYQWKRGGSAISSATGRTYTLTQADVGAKITVTVSWTDSGSTMETLTSAATANVANTNDAPTGAVTITGMVTQGETLTAETSGISDPDGPSSLTFTYQWKRGGADISSATGRTYTLTQADVGKAITVTVSWTDAGSTVETLTSAATANVANTNDSPTGAVTITGTVTQGETLTADTSTISDPDGPDSLTFTYQWTRDGSAISSATQATYTLTQADVGAPITVTVSWTDSGSTVETLTSAATSNVANVNDPPTGAVTLTGTVTQGETLTAVTSTIVDPDGPSSPTFSYQWKRDGTAIVGATSGTYILTQADVGAAITVTVSWTDASSTAESLTSAATSSVALSVKITGVVPHTTKIEGNKITAEVINGAGVQLTLPAGHGVTKVAFAVPRARPAAPAGVTFGAEPASLEIRLDAPLASAATVCLQQPAGLSGTLFVYHLADKAQTWEKLSPAAAPRGYVCGETGSFSVFVVGSPLPGFGAASIEEYNWTVGEAVDVRLPAATGGDGPITYRLSPALPAGLSFEAKARTITGTPTEAVAKTRFTDTATDADGQTGQLHFRVTVQAAEVTHRSRALTVALAAFGRTAATEAVAVIGRRFGAPPVGKPAVTVGGTAVPALDVRSVAGVLGGVLGLTGASRDSAGRGRAAEGRVAPSRSPRLAATDVFARSEFAVPLTGTNEGELTTGWTFWGTGAASGFSSQLLETDGAVYTGYVGLDYRFGQKGLAGVAVSHSVGGLDYEVAGDFLLVSGERGGIRGEVDLAMTSVLPYVHYTPSPGLGLWGLAGAGVGELEVQDAAGRVETDVQLLLAAVGGRQALTTWHGIEVAVKSDAFAVRVKADEAAGLAAVTGVAHRARVALAMKTDVALSPESALQPSVELGGRWDNGDAETGMGAELSGGVEYQQRWWGVSLAARGRYLLAHQATDFEAWGGSLAVKVGEGLGGQGLWVAFEPTWGTPASGVEQLWGREAGPAGNGAPAGGAVGRLTADVGYGLALRRPGWRVTPYGGVATGPATSRYRLGGHLQVHEAMALSLEGIQQTTLDSATEHGIVFSWTVGL